MLRQRFIALMVFMVFVAAVAAGASQKPVKSASEKELISSLKDKSANGPVGIVTSSV